MLSSDNGSAYADSSTLDGGFASIGTGASRALPAGGWRLPLSPFAPPPASQPGWEGKVPFRPRPLPSDGSGVTTTSPNGAGGDATQTDTMRLIDLFRSMFGNQTTKAAAPDQGAVVVYGDSTQTGAGASTGVKLLIVAAVAFASWWAWKKWGKNAIAA